MPAPAWMPFNMSDRNFNSTVATVTPGGLPANAMAISMVGP